jgi:CO dehydrogenase maturation factor
MIIGVSGKGGVGKTTFTALLIRILKNLKKNILAIDADPDANLASALGINYSKSIGDLREEFLKFRDKLSIGPKERYLESKAFEILTETEDFDLLVMGRPEGPGCYCYVNHLLREIIDKFSKNYDFVVIDTEAGLEHMSRRTTSNVDIMFILVDESRNSFETVRRIKKIMNEIETSFKKLYLVGNKIALKNIALVEKIARNFDCSIIGFIPEDPEIKLRDLEGLSIYELDQNSESIKAVDKIVKKVGL